jgi:YVTN family beta-propeller protein
VSIGTNFKVILEVLMSVTCVASRAAPMIARAFLGLLVLPGTGLVQGLAAEPTLGQGTVFTADEEGGSISRIDLSSGEVRSISLPLTPHNVDVSTGAGLVFVVGVGRATESQSGESMGPMMDMDSAMATGDGHSPAAGTEESGGVLAVFDIEGMDRGPVAEIEVGHHPAHVVPDLNGERVFVTDSETNIVSVIDLDSQEVVKTVATGRYPHGLRLSPDGRELFVANVEDGSVSVIDVASLTEAQRIPVGKTPVQVGFTPDGSRVYVSLRDEDAVAVIDRSSRRVTTKIPVGRRPIQVYVTPDGRSVYVANQGSDEDPDNRVSIIDAASNQVTETLTVGAGAHGVAISRDGRFAYVTNIKENSVSVIDTTTQTVVQTVPVGRGPNGIAVFSGNL